MNIIYRLQNHFYQRYLQVLYRINPIKAIKTSYKDMTQLELNLDNPKTFHEKVMWLSYNTDTTRWSQLSDKYLVREYVESLGFRNNLTELYGVYDSPEQIDYDSLPSSFVVKMNNGSASVILVKDKSKLDLKETASKLKMWLKNDYGKRTAQPHYSRIVPKIIIEEYLSDPHQPVSLNDYKFFCFNGEPLYVLAIYERDGKTHKYRRQFFDIEWNRMNVGPSEEVNVKDIDRPQSLQAMLEMSRKLSQGLKFVRVDLYEVNGKVYFGELTFTPGFNSSVYCNQLNMGDYICL